MHTRIPLPEAPNYKFNDVFDYWQKMKEMKEKRPFLEARTKEAQANALKSQMFTKLMNQALGIGDQDINGYQMTPEEQQQRAQLKPGESMVVGQSAPSNDRAKQMLYALGMLKETPQEQSQREQQNKIAAEQRAEEYKKNAEQRHIENMISQNKGTSAVKSGLELKKSARSLENTAHLVNQLDEILNKNPDLTGIGAGAANKFNLSKNPELGKFITTAGKLQAELGKYASSRGGIQAVKWAQSVKPSEWKDVKFNKGMIDAIRQNLNDEYQTLNDEYRDITGQELPIGSKSKDGTVKWKMINGKLQRE